MISKTLSILVLASSALATVFVTSPQASTTFHGGQAAQITWQDSPDPPTLQQFGNAKISIYAGNAQQQTLLQSISPGVNVDTTRSISFTPDPKIGPNDSNYFIRFESLTATDPKDPAIPALAFSAKFTLDGMSGAFSDVVKAQIAGQSTAPLAGQPAPTSAAAPSSSPSRSAAPSGSASRAQSSSASRTSAAATASRSSGALSTKAGWAGVILSALVGVTVF